MPDAPGLELIAHEINPRHEGAIAGTTYDRERAVLLTTPEHIRNVLLWLKEEPGQEYTFLASVHGADYLPAEPRFAIHYELLNMARVERVSVKCLIEATEGDAPPQTDTVIDIFPTADFQEREIYDFFGIVFDGHPDMRRILLPEDYVGFPQRRDFPVGGDPVIFTNTEDEVPGWTR
jgi:NADH-quinone oxidoreductase subunit C